MGRRVAIVGRVGDDEGGELLRHALRRDGVDTSALLTTADAPNGVALIAVDADGDNAIVVSPGANARLSPADIDTAGPLVRDAAVVLLQLEIPLDAVLAAVRVARGTVIVNPAPATPLPPEILEAVDILVPNQTELALLAGHEGPVDHTVAADLARRLPVRSTVVTLGGAGAMIVTAHDAILVDAPRVTPVDTTAWATRSAVRWPMPWCGGRPSRMPSARRCGSRRHHTPAGGTAVPADTCRSRHTRQAMRGGPEAYDASRCPAFPCSSTATPGSTTPSPS
ncbi:MAG: ribokinase [Acidimicrobiales bacterium]